MAAKRFVQIVEELKQLRQKILDQSSKAPETYKVIFGQISKNSDGLADPADPIEVARVWFSGVEFAFSPHSTFYPEDVEQLVNETPKHLSAAFELSQFRTMIEHLEETAIALKADLKKYVVLELEREKERTELQTRYEKYLHKKEWEKEVEDRDRDLRSREYRKEYKYSQADLFEIVYSLCSEYVEQQSSDVSIDGDKNYYFTGRILPDYFVLHYESDLQLGHNILWIQKLYTLDSENLVLEPSSYEAIPEFANGASFYAEIGHIVISKTLDDDSSMVFVKTENADLLDFFKSLITKIDSTTKSKTKKILKRSPNLDTPRKLQALIDVREEAIKRNVDIPYWSTALKLAGIDHKTAIRYLEDLRVNWEDKTYHWTGDIENLGY